MFRYPLTLEDAHSIRLSNMADRVKNVAVEEVDRIKSLTAEAVRSRAYLYPIKVGGRQRSVRTLLRQS